MYFFLKHRLQNIDKIANKTAANLLKNDLQKTDKSSYEMKSIDSLTANQIFGIFDLEDPVCDENHDGILSELELKCLNKIWQYYVPKDK